MSGRGGWARERSAYHGRKAAAEKRRPKVRLHLAAGETHAEDVTTTAADGTEVTQRVVRHRTLCGALQSHLPHVGAPIRTLTCDLCIEAWDAAHPGDA